MSLANKLKNISKSLKLLKCLKFIALSILLLQFNGCALFQTSKSGQADGPPLHYMDVSKIPNAVPKIEPPSKYGNPRVYTVFGKQYQVMSSSKNYQETGTASWYGRKFHGRRTSNGEVYDVYQMTAAHKTLPLPTYLKVKNLDNHREIIVKVNDRGPFHSDRIIDLSFAAAKKLGLSDKGTGRVHLTAIDPKHFSPQKQAWPLSLAQRTEQPTPPTTEQDAFYLQLGAFSSKSNAMRLARQTRHYTQQHQKLLKTYIDSPGTSTIPLYRVRVGPFKQIEDAEDLKIKLAQATPVTPEIIKGTMLQ